MSRRLLIVLVLLFFSRVALAQDGAFGSPIHTTTTLQVSRGYRVMRPLGAAAIGVYGAGAATLTIALLSNDIDQNMSASALGGLAMIAATPVLLTTNGVTLHLIRRAGGHRSPALFIVSLGLEGASLGMMFEGIGALSQGNDGTMVMFAIPTALASFGLACVDYGIDGTRGRDAGLGNRPPRFQVGLAPVAGRHWSGLALAGRF